MRLADEQTQAIRQLTRKLVGERCNVRAFGSRLDDAARGGDIDLLLELTDMVDNPALIAAQLSVRVSRAMHGRKVDVLLSAPILCACPSTISHSRKDSCYDIGCADRTASAIFGSGRE